MHISPGVKLNELNSLTNALFQAQIFPLCDYELSALLPAQNELLGSCELVFGQTAEINVCALAPRRLPGARRGPDGSLLTGGLYLGPRCCPINVGSVSNLTANGPRCRGGVSGFRRENAKHDRGQKTFCHGDDAEAASGGQPTSHLVKRHLRELAGVLLRRHEVMSPPGRRARSHGRPFLP